jgi:hypothetical protein
MHTEIISLQARLVIAKIRDAATEGTAVDMSELLNSFVNDIVCHAVSGKFFREEGRNKLFQELVEANSSLLGGFNVVDYFPVLVKLDMIKRMVCAKAQKVNKMWDDLLNKLIDDHASKTLSESDGEESDFIDVLLSLQQEYKLTRDHIKAQLVVCLNINDLSDNYHKSIIYMLLIIIYMYPYVCRSCLQPAQIHHS